jgi:outer membrane protein TolC
MNYLIVSFLLFNYSVSAYSAQDSKNNFSYFLKQMIKKNGTYLGVFLKKNASIERLSGTFGLYMPSLTAGISKDRSEGEFSLDKQESRTEGLTLQGSIPQLGLNYSSLIYSETETISPSPSYYKGSFNYTLELNLLKDFGPRVGYIPFDLAKNNRDLAQYELIKVIFNQFNQLLSAYTTASASQRNLKINEDSLVHTEKELKRYEELFKLGKIPKLSLLAIESQYQQLKSQIISQEKNLRDSFVNLYSLASINEEINYNKELLPLPELFNEEEIKKLISDPLDFEKLKNPDLLMTKKNLENSKLNLKLSENNVYPSLTLEYTSNGQKTLSERRSSLFPSRERGETIAVNFSMPLGLITEKRELAASRNEFKADQLNLEQLKRELFLQWKNLVEQYGLTKKQLDLAKNLVKATKDKFDASIPTGQLGPTYQQTIISYQNEWVSAQINLNQIEIELLGIQLSILSFHADNHLIEVLNRLAK